MTPTKKPGPSLLASHWALDPSIVYLNHGSFGATPARVLEAQNAIRARMESEAVRFFVEDAGRWKLVGELAVDAITPSATLEAFTDRWIPLGGIMTLSAGARIGASMHNANEGMVAHIEGGHY